MAGGLLVSSPVSLPAQLSLRVGALRTTPFINSTSVTAFTIGPRYDFARGRSEGFVDATFMHFDSSWAFQLGAREASTLRLRGVGVWGQETTLQAAVVGATSTGRLEHALALGRSFGPVLGSFGASAGALRDTRGTFSFISSVRVSLMLKPVSARVQRFMWANTRYTDVALSAAASRGIVAFAVSTGRRYAGGGHEAIQLIQVSVQPTPWLGIELTDAKNPPSPEGFATSNYAAIGVRLTAAARVRPPAIERTTTGARVAFAVDGREVAIAGEWNNWTPVPMAKDAAGRWSAELPLGAGAHKFVLIVDGKNVVPRGSPKLPDGFGGEVGLLVI